MAKQSRTVDVTIRLNKDNADRLDDIVRALESSGLRNADVHRRFLMVSGSVAAELIEALRAVEGVTSVREDRTYKAQASPE
jgi:hypothetical protein